MSLFRLFLFLLLCYLVLAAIKAIAGGRKKKPSERRNFDQDGEEMVLDPQCHSYIAKSDAVLKSGQYFCSQECARLYLAR
jgi:Prokaryotic metallothionein